MNFSFFIKKKEQNLFQGLVDFHNHILPNVDDGSRSLEQSLKINDCGAHFCFGESPSLADICLIPQVYNALRFHCNLSKYPIIESIWNHCISLDAFKRAAPESQPDAPE